MKQVQIRRIRNDRHLFSVNAGCLTARVFPASAGTNAEVRIEPSAHGLLERIAVQTSKQGPLSVRVGATVSLVRVEGSIPAGSKPYLTRFAHPDPVELFGNVLRLDRLDRAAGRAAIVRPLERWGELEGEAVVAEDVLVERVLDGVGAGRIELGPGGLGAVENGSPRGIEAPYLQLVMQRLWDVERGAGSSTLRAETLDALGGAGQIVADHLERAIEALTSAQREIAARLFDHLVTPSGTKIAHQATEPQNTPATTAAAPAGPPVPAPMLANSAANDRIVAGLVIVRPYIDAQPPIGDPSRPGSSRAATGVSVRASRSAFAASSSSAIPPTMPSQRSMPTSSSVTAVSPNAAIAP